MRQPHGRALAGGAALGACIALVASAIAPAEAQARTSWQFKLKQGPKRFELYEQDTDDQLHARLSLEMAFKFAELQLDEPAGANLKALERQFANPMAFADAADRLKKPLNRTRWTDQGRLGGALEKLAPDALELEFVSVAALFTLGSDPTPLLPGTLDRLDADGPTHIVIFYERSGAPLHAVTIRKSRRHTYFFDPYLGYARSSSTSVGRRLSDKYSGLGCEQFALLEVARRAGAGPGADAVEIDLDTLLEEKLEYMKRVSIMPSVLLDLPEGDAFTLLDAGDDTTRVRLTPTTQGNEIGAATLSGRGGTRIYYLPWKSRRVVHMTLGRKSDVFFTAALSGCSVLAKGPPDSPTVYHAGIEGSIDAKVMDLVQDAQKGSYGLIQAARKKDAPEFWKTLLFELGAAGPDEPLGEINKTHYMTARGAHTKRSERFMGQFDRMHSDLGLEVTHASPFGCVFGFRGRRGWELYLQENVVIRYKQTPTRKEFATSLPIAIVRFYPPTRRGEPLDVWSMEEDERTWQGLPGPFDESDTVICTRGG